LLVLFYQGLLRSFGHFNHDEMIAVYFMVVLAFTPCGDAFSLDSRFAKTKTQRPAFAYALSDSADATVAGLGLFQLRPDQASVWLDGGI
jgi:hypothetical protein